MLCLMPIKLVYAQELYGGVGFGKSTTYLDTSDANQAQRDLQSLGVTASLAVDQKDTGKKIFVGYLVNPNFAVEGMYVDFGKSTLSLSASKGTKHSQENADFKATGFGVSALGIIPIGDVFSMFGKIGILRSTAKASGSYDSNLDDPQWSESESSSQTKPFFGIGAQVAINKTVGVRLEHERFKKIGDDNKTGETDIRLTTLNLVVRFN